MEWYYEGRNDQAGPISDEELHALVNAGTITAATLVWNSGMSGWKEYGSIDSPASYNDDQINQPRAFCCECHRSFSQENMIKYGELWICGDCKPVFVQKLKEGVRTHNMNYAGFWIRLAAYIIDIIILFAVNMIFFIPFIIYMIRAASSGDPTAGFGYSIILNIISSFISIGYETLFIGKWGATLGKMACGLRVLSSEGKKISYLRAFGRVFAKMLSGMIFAIGYIMAAFDDEKRGLHDRICDTRVISR